MDVKTAFLNGDLEETIFMEPPKRYEDFRPNEVCHLLKSIYGLKQAPCCWDKKFTETLRQNGFVQSTANPCVFMKHRNDGVLVIGMYVDDCLIVGNTGAITAIKRKV
eukprot:TRINITY_DN8274_c0_g1_i2.p1 TRINITY_DN8274_c0_g1~~TRINITY_DN8274_c0_g1_i2.p1  ORF type:complete len:107 (-),score=8.64 TRINITY_DN8274_c0_g1_i2:1092-1412(-)